MKYKIFFVLLLLAAVGYGQKVIIRRTDTLYQIKFVYVSENAPDTLTIETLKPVRVRLIGDFYPINDFSQPHHFWDITNEEYARVLLWRNQEDLKKIKNKKTSIK